MLLQHRQALRLKILQLTGIGALTRGEERRQFRLVVLHASVDFGADRTRADVTLGILLPALESLAARVCEGRYWPEPVCGGWLAKY